MIKPVDNINFKSRYVFTYYGYSKHTPKPRPYTYREFMPEKEKRNWVISLIKKILTYIKGSKDAR